MSVHQRDCIDMREHVRDASVDLVITSPPYAMRRKATYGGIETERYAAWFLARSAAFKAALKETGSFVLNIKEHCEDGQRSLYVMKLVITLVEEQGWRLTDEFIWHKPNPVPGAWNGRLKDGWEHLYHFTKAKGYKFFADEVRQPMREGSTGKATPHPCDTKGRTEKQTKSGFGFAYSKYNEREAERAKKFGGLTALPSNVLTEKVGSAQKVLTHSAVFPAAIPEFFIKLLTEPGDVVCDPFAGSGTTLVAAKQLGREAIGFEIDPGYCEAINRRLSETLL